MDEAIMMYVVQKNSSEGDKLWLSHAKPSLIWGDKRHAMLFETRALAQMAAQMAARFENALEVVFIPDPVRWRAA
ncbi:MAG TPA: hypothetical protein VG328_16115 [Stellaceae bacterium]|jgi:hypothetical protein|nr:hypothetical protein [Stellaceae bacterium]